MDNFSNFFLVDFVFRCEMSVNRLSGVLQVSQTSALFPNRIYSVRVLTLNIVIFRKRLSTKALVFPVISQWIAVLKFHNELGTSNRFQIGPILRKF